MKLKNLLIVIAVFFSWNTFAQQTQGPNSISQGTFVGTTIALRDMPSVTEKNSLTKEELNSLRSLQQDFQNIQFELGIVKVGGDAVKVEEPEEEKKDK